jgi:hypothetical protein
MQLPAGDPATPTGFHPVYLGVDRRTENDARLAVLLVPDTDLGLKGGAVDDCGVAAAVSRTEL